MLQEQIIFTFIKLHNHQLILQLENMENGEIKIIPEKPQLQNIEKCFMPMNSANPINKIDEKHLNFPDNKIQKLTILSNKIETYAKFGHQLDQQNQLGLSFQRRHAELNSVGRYDKLVGIQQSAAQYKQNQKVERQQIQHDFEKTYISMLREISGGDCFKNENIARMKHFFYERMREMDQKGLLTENEKSHINLFINSHMSHFDNSIFNSELNIVNIKCQDSQENYKIIPNGHEDQLKKQQFGSPAQLQSKKINKKSNKNGNDITKFMHPKYLIFLNESMRKLQIYKEIKQICIQKSVWMSQHSITAFIYKLMAIKKLVPWHFPSIIKEFIALVEQFNSIQSTKPHQIYAKQILSPRYLNCIKMYAEHDDIEPIIYQLYDVALAPSRLAHKLRLFLDFQAKIKQIPHQQHEQDIIKEENISITEKEQVMPALPPTTVDKFRQVEDKEQPKIKFEQSKKTVLMYSKKKGYPTKNFLSLFKFPHRKFINQKVSHCEEINELPKYFDKTWITKEDYCKLYTHPQLRDNWKSMFESKILYRSLLLSRANIQQKISYIKKIFRFEEAYRTKSFQRIN